MLWLRNDRFQTTYVFVFNLVLLSTLRSQKMDVDSHSVVGENNGHNRDEEPLRRAEGAWTRQEVQQDIEQRMLLAEAQRNATR